MQIRKDEQRWIREAWQWSCEKVEAAAAQIKAQFPFITHSGRYDSSAAVDWWTNGFWPGMLWILYRQTGKDCYRVYAQQCEEKMDAALEAFEGLHHDVGFMWLPSAVADYCITGEEQSRIRGLKAASILASRFNLAGGFIRAWPDWGGDNRGLAIIDCMMNLPILYWASRQTNDPRFRLIAMRHADMAMETFVRPDGSCNHMVRFDPQTGAILEKPGGQGYGEGSAWSRGGAWAIYGFVLSYIHTGKQEYLETAQRTANYFIAGLEENGAVPCDFKSPPEPWVPDSSAGAVAACGLIEIARNTEEREGNRYLSQALRILRWLYESCTQRGENTHALLLHATGAYHDEKSRDVSYIFGDYYWLEALWKLNGNDLLFW